MSVSTTTAILVTSEETMPVTTVSARMPSVSGVTTTSIAPVLTVDPAVTHSVFGHGVSNSTAVVRAAETTPLASTVVGTVGTSTSTCVVSVVGTTPTVVSLVGTTTSTHDVSAMETAPLAYIEVTSAVTQNEKLNTRFYHISIT